MAAFDRLIQLINDGESVSAGVTNRPLRALDQNVRVIWDLLQAAAIGSTVYTYDATVEAEAAVGMPVYYRTSSQRFERGLAGLDVTPGSALLQTADAARVWGIVAAKSNATKADILLFGLATIDISAAVSGSVTAGTYYLSGSTPGQLTQQTPPISVAVLRSLGDGRVFVMPQFVDFLDRHVHYRFDLVCKPAGQTTPPVPGDRHVITDADADRAGWLPAAHPVFQGKAPAQAAFGYNLSVDADLRNAWPPLPIDGAYVELDKGLDEDQGFHGVPLGKNGLVIVDRNGIWWLSNCYGDVPWPLSTDTTGTSSTYSDSDDIECVRHLNMALRLWFSRPNFRTENLVVTSLRSKDARLKVHCVGTDTDATAGDLELTLNLNLTVNDDQAGYLALKSFDPDTNKFTRGPVVEGIYTEGDNVSLTGTTNRHVDPADDSSPLAYQGLIRLEVSKLPTHELEVQLVRLGSATEEFFEDLMYLGLPAGKNTEYRARLDVPSDVELTSPQVALRFYLLGRVAGTLPALTITARRLTRPPAGLTTPVALPDDTDEFSVTVNSAAVLASANTYVEVNATAFTVAAGDVIYFTVSRAGSTDGYTSDVGVLNHVGILSSGS